MKYIAKAILVILLAVLFLSDYGFSQPLDPGEIRNLVEVFKKDERGPYKAIRWFCPDGTILPPDQRCLQPGGIQHAIHKDVVERLTKERAIYLGQILAGTPFPDFLDANNEYSRVKQYQMERYLQLVDDGWIFRRARYYRGAIQLEDEESWGLNFLKSLAAKDTIVRSQFFLLRQAIKDIPHKADEDRWRFIRTQSKAIADAFPAFSNLRVKLHGQPEPGDLQRVKDFQTHNRQRIPVQIDEMIKSLIKELELAYQPSHLLSLDQYIAKLPSSLPVRDQLKKLIESYGHATGASGNYSSTLSQKIKETADLLWNIRKSLLTVREPKTRLAMLDLSNALESILFLDVSSWQPQTVGELLEINYALAKAVAGCGFLEVWEWEMINPVLRPTYEGDSLSLERFIEIVDGSRRIGEWGAGMVRAHYGSVVNLFSSFEPLAAGFIDDRVHSSILLSLGDTAGQLLELVAHFTGITNHVFDISNQHQIRGVNPGFTVGELEVIAGPIETTTLSSNKVYVLSQVPADLKPVAGIATLSEGNLVSHVQLLSRNLGIPNAVISQQNFNDLIPFAGQRVFYAVSHRGTVLMKPAADMTSEEKTLVEVRKKRGEKIAVPTGKIDLRQVDLISLKNLRASDSGRVCGPKAANLGQLKSLFPGRVVDGLVIPFGIFRQHLDQQMPGTSLTYWQFLHATFIQASKERKNGKGEEEIEAIILERLAQLRESIQNIPLLPDFRMKLRDNFQEEFGVKIGRVPVFIRSDTNMEDLKDFTGAGLNLTVFNVLEEDKILQAIRDVWASPFTERSYRWRQKYLLNPENVYPSILILPSVNVDKSGVMITTGVSTSNPGDTTIAFSLGVGGAVEGEVAESYLLRNDGSCVLLSPSREIQYTVLPVREGTDKVFTNLDQPILDAEELKQLRELAGEIRQKLPSTPGIETAGPFDVELGFKDKVIWLFQVRPYVENKRARSSTYLQSLDPKIPKNVFISWDEKLKAGG